MSPINASRGSITTSRGTLLTYPAVADPTSVPPGFGWDVRVRCSAGTAVLGGTSVTATGPTAGYRLVPTQPVSLNLDPGETLCAVRPTSGTTTVEVLYSTRD